LPESASEIERAIEGFSATIITEHGLLMCSLRPP